jgi:hypothetical protein
VVVAELGDGARFFDPESVLSPCYMLSFLWYSVMACRNFPSYCFILLASDPFSVLFSINLKR